MNSHVKRYERRQARRFVRALLSEPVTEISEWSTKLQPMKKLHRRHD